MNHHISHLTVCSFYSTSNILMIVHEFRHDVQFRQVFFIYFQIGYIIHKVFAAPDRQRIHMVDEFIENQCSFLCIHKVRFISIILKLIQLIRQLMFKRSPTLEKQDHHFRDKQSELLTYLNKCIYLPYDDKMIVRMKIKEKDQEIMAIFEGYRKNNVLSELQVNLRKYIKQQKERIADQDQDNFRNMRKSSTQKRVYSQKSLPKSKPTSTKASPERQQSKSKIIKIDINQLRRTMMNNTQKLCINSSRNDIKPLYQTKTFRSKRYLQAKPQNQMNRKISAGTINLTQRQQINYYDFNTEPTMYYLQNSQEKVKQKGKNNNHYLINDVFFTEDIESLMKSKLTKRKSSAASNVSSQQKFVNKSSKNMHRQVIYQEQCNKENMEVHNRLQSRQTPFFTDRPNFPINDCNSIKQSQLKQGMDPKFGQFYKKIKQIMKSDR